MQDMGIFIRENLEAIRVSTLDEVQLTHLWKQIWMELQDSTVEILQEDLAQARIVLPELEWAAAAGNVQGLDAGRAEEGDAQDAKMQETGTDVGAGAETERAGT